METKKDLYVGKDTQEQIKEKITILLPIYGPTIGLAMMSTGMILLGNRVNRRRYASVVGLYSVASRQLYKWEEVIESEFGADKLSEMRGSVNKPESSPTIFFESGDDVLVYDVHSDRYFKVRTVEDIRRCVNDMNEQLYQDDWVSLNDLYYELGVPKVEYGDEVGWFVEDGNIKTTIDAIVVNGRPCLTMSFLVLPKHMIRK